MASWITTDDAFASWEATLGVRAWREPAFRQSFVREVLQAGLQTEIYAVQDAEGWVERLAAQGPAAPLFPPRAQARVTLHGTSRWCDDLATLRPGVRLPHVPAIELSGPLVFEPDHPMLLMLSLPSNLWFPEVFDLETGWVPQGQDASEGAVRFDRFLAALRHATETHDGSLRLDSVLPLYDHLVAERGLT